MKILPIILFSLIFLMSVTIFCPEEKIISNEDIKLIADKIVSKVNQIQNYEAIMVKHERVRGHLQDYEYAHIKVRHDPYSVYIKFLKPEKIVNREVIYNSKDNHNDIIQVKQGGLKNPNLTLRIRYDSPIALAGQRYTVKDAGIKKLVNGLRDILLTELKFNPTVTKFDNVKLYGRPGILYRLVHSSKHVSQRCMAAEIFIDDELCVPTYFKSWEWGMNNEPLLVEEYAYKDLRINVELSDKDFNY